MKSARVRKPYGLDCGECSSNIVSGGMGILPAMRGKQLRE